jgi:hypothetical protein
MRTTPPARKPYTVEYTPAAWRHIGSLSWDEFSCLQKALNRIAEVATAALPAAPPEHEVLEAQVAGLAFGYSVDAGARVVHLVGLSRQARRSVRGRAAGG